MEERADVLMALSIYKDLLKGLCYIITYPSEPRDSEGKGCWDTKRY